MKNWVLVLFLIISLFAGFAIIFSCSSDDECGECVCENDDDEEDDDDSDDDDLADDDVADDDDVDDDDDDDTTDDDDDDAVDDDDDDTSDCEDQSSYTSCRNTASSDRTICWGNCDAISDFCQKILCQIQCDVTKANNLRNCAQQYCTQDFGEEACYSVCWQGKYNCVQANSCSDTQTCESQRQVCNSGC